VIYFDYINCRILDKKAFHPFKSDEMDGISKEVLKEIRNR